MNSMARINHQSTLLNLSLHNNKPPFSSKPKPHFSSSLSLSFKPSKTLTKALKSTTTASLPLPSPSSLKTQNPLFFSPNTQNPLFSLLKTTCITIITTTLILTCKFTTKPSIAAPISQQTSLESLSEDSVEEKERVFEEYLDSHPDDVKALKGLMGVKIKARKFEEAIPIIERLVLLEPFEKEWPLLKSHVYSYNGNIEMAKKGFEEILEKDPLLVEAYHGLVMTAAQGEDGELEVVMKRIEGAMEKCKKEKKGDLRDFKLLLAQGRVVQGKYTDALKVYKQLVKDEPRDFRPYLCQGIIYTLLQKQDEADKQFQKYRRLVPKGHPYARYFEDNMIATKMFSQMAENQKVGSKS